MVYVNGSRLCGQCASKYSHVGLVGKCDECPEPGQNIGVAIAGVFAGIVFLFIYIQITLTDNGSLDESDGAKSIGMSYVQLISLLVKFPIDWPPIFVAIFQVGGAITVLGQHLVNLKCMLPEYTDADVFYSVQVTWGVVPPSLLAACVATWHFVDKCMPCFPQSDLSLKIKASCVALLYLVWPSLCSQTFSLFACRSVCEEETSFLRADLDESCWTGRHLTYALGLGLPMLFLYVVGLPLAAYLRVWRLRSSEIFHRDDGGGYRFDPELIPEEHKTYGIFL